MEEKNFEITMNCYDKTVTVKYDHPDVTINEIMEAITGCMRALTFGEDQIMKMCEDYINDYGDK